MPHWVAVRGYNVSTNQWLLVDSYWGIRKECGYALMDDEEFMFKWSNPFYGLKTDYNISRRRGIVYYPLILRKSQ